MIRKDPQQNYFLPTDLGPMSLWLDFDNYQTIFQDTAGTNPVTAIGQTIARVNDLSGNGAHFTEATNGPTYAKMDGETFGAYFGATKYLNSSLVSLGLLYQGSPFTLVAHVGVGSFNIDPQIFLDSSNFNAANDGITIYFYNFNQFYAFLMNNDGHLTPVKGGDSFESDPEYMTAGSEVRSLTPNSNLAFCFANDSSNGHWMVGERYWVSTTATGSPASAASPYAMRLGSTALGATSGWKNHIRRLWIWPSFLSQRSRSIAISEISKPSWIKRQC